MQRSRSALAARLLAPVLFVAGCCAGFLPAAGAEETVPGLASESRSDQTAVELAKLYDAVVETTEKAFFDEALMRELDWRGRAKAVRPSVLAAATTEEAVRRINGLLAELKTSHTALFTPDDYDYYILLDAVGAGANGPDLMSRRFWGSGTFYPGIGAFTRQIDGRHFVDGILEGSPAERTGLKYGDELLLVDGAPYSPVAAFRRKIGTTVELSVRREANAEPQSLRIPVVPIKPARAFSEATAASARIIERNGRRIGYAHIWALGESDSFQAALAKLGSDSRVTTGLWEWSRTAASSMRGVPAKDDMELAKPLDFLIVDLRGRVGGSVGVAQHNLEALDPERASYWGDWRSVNRARPQVGPVRPQNPSFRGRSALLIDRHTRSAAEIMAHGYKRSAFGPVVGTPTAGAVSSGATFVMPGDLLLYVAVAGHEFDGRRLEGAGVTPDHRVERPLPYAAGADPVLEAAADLLANQALK